MPISAILLYEQVRGDLKRLPRTFFSPLPPYPPSSEVYKAVRRIYRATYMHNVNTHARTLAHVSACICVCVCVCVYARSSAPRYSSLLAKCLHALFEANVHEILMYSHIPPEKRSRVRAIFVDDAQVSTRKCTCIDGYRRT